MNIPPPITRHLQFMKKDTLLCDVWFNAFEDKVTFKNHTTDWIDLPFGRMSDSESTTYSALEYVLAEDHCFPRERADAAAVLSYLGLEDYDPLAIIQKTHGVMWNSHIWIKFDTDPPELSWEDVKHLADR